MILFQEASWIWVRTGEPIDFSVWAPAEPDDNGPYEEDCLFYYAPFHGKWGDFDCSYAIWGDPNRPICQRKITILDQ